MGWSDMGYVPGLEPFEIEEAVDRALAEDLSAGDPTTDSLIPPGRTGRASVVAKGEGILAGGDVALAVWRRLDASIRVLSILPEGSSVRPFDPASGREGDVIAEIEGDTAAILKGERTAINFLQYLSGVATETDRFVRAVEGLPTRIVDTRKTVPGLRTLQKYAVRVGAGATTGSTSATASSSRTTTSRRSGPKARAWAKPCAARECAIRSGWRSRSRKWRRCRKPWMQGRTYCCWTT